MSMHPDLEHAFGTGVSMREVIEIFAEHHCGPIEEKVQYHDSWENRRHHISEFWDNHYPLFRQLSVFEARIERIEVREPFLSIHRALARDIISWLCDSGRKSSVYLIAEPWRTRKSVNGYSRAAAIAKICSDAQRFGNVFHIRNSDDTAYNIGWLSAELAAAYPPYRHLLTRILINYPGIRRLPGHSLFKTLIHDPWKAIQYIHPRYSTAPPVVVLSFHRPYDEDFFRLIYEFGSLSHSSPLLWIISVSPKFKLPIQAVVEPFTPRYTTPLVCYNEALTDAELILHHKFSALRQEYDQTFDDNKVWPSDEQTKKLARIVLGVFEFIDVIIQFIDWEEDGGPQAHLEAFLGYMVDSPTPSGEQRYRALDHFYTHALSSIPQDVLFDVKKAFSIIRWQHSHLDLVQLLGLESFKFATSLQYFYRLVSPFHMGYHNKNSCTNHFRRFVEDPNRSGKFFTPKSESRLQAYRAWLHFLSNHSSDLHIILQPPMLRLSQADLTHCASQISRLRYLALSRLCQMARADTTFKLLLHHFDFRCLAHNCDNIVLQRFVTLINDLYEGSKVDNFPGIVRVEAVSILDRQFIHKCQGLAEPFELGDESKQHRKVPKYVLLGYGAATVLAVMASREQYYETIEGIGVETLGGVTIYTSGMLAYI